MEVRQRLQGLSSGPPRFWKTTLVSSLRFLQEAKSTAASIAAADRQIQGSGSLLLKHVLLILPSLKAKYKNPF